MSEPPLILDESGPVRYNWPEIKLLYMSGAGVSDIAKSLTLNLPEFFDKVRSNISQKSSRDDWPTERQNLSERVSQLKLAGSNTDAAKNLASSHCVASALNSLGSERKAKYLERTSKFADKASELLDSRAISTLEDAAMAAKLFQPVHELARDIHGLNGKDVGNQVQVNILSDWADKVPPWLDLDDQKQNTSE